VSFDAGQLDDRQGLPISSSEWKVTVGSERDAKFPP
jgi:hypothetical protein